MKLTKFGKKILAFFLVATSALFLFACQQGGTGATGGTSPRAEAKQHVQELLSQFKFGDTIDGVCTEVKSANFEIQEDLDGVVSEEDWANASYSEYRYGLSASFESSNPEVLYPEWQTSVTREYVTEGEEIVGIEMGERKALVFVVNPQEELTEVVVTITVTASYEVNGHAYTYKDSQDTVFTIGAKVGGDAVEMTIGEMQALAMADWAAFESNGLVDAEGNKYSVAMKGVVTEVLWGDGSDTHSFMMSDENGDNVFVYAPAGSAMIGDEVIVTGVPAAYYKGIQIGSGASVEILSGGHEVAAPLEISIDEWYEKYDISVNHNAVGERIKAKAVLTYDGSNYILKSVDTDKHFVIYYKSYNSYELELLKQFLGKVAVYEFAVYDYHSAGYWRALVNNYDYVPEEVVLTDEEALDADLTTITPEFEVKEGETVTIPTGALVNGSVIGEWSADIEGLVNIETGVVTLGDLKETTIVTLTATVTKGEVVKEVQIKVTIVYVNPKAPVYNVVSTFEEDVAYKFGVVQSNLDQTLYLNGQMDGYYFGSTDDLATAIDVYVEVVEDGYHLYTLVSDAKSYIEAYANGTYINVRYAETASVVWTYNAEYNTFVTLIDENEYYLGTYKTYDTFSASKLSYAATSFVGHLYEKAPITTVEEALNAEVGDKVELTVVVDEITTEWSDKYGNISVNVKDRTGVILAYRLAANVKVGDVIKITGKVGAYQGVNQIAAGATAEVVEGVNPMAWQTVEEVLAAPVDTPCEITGKVVEIDTEWSDKYGNISVVVEDATGKVLAYRLATYVELGDIIKITGTVGSYKEVNQIAAGCTAEIIEKAPVEEPEQPGDSESVTIDFSDKANRTEFSTEIQVWEQNGIKVTNNKAASTTNVGDYANPARFYASSELIIEGAAKIAKVVITTAGNKNFNANFTLEGYTVTVDGTTCIIESAEGVDNITIAQLPYQVRVATIEVFYEGEGEDSGSEEEPETPSVITTVAGALAGESGAAVELTGKVVEIYYAWDEGYGNMSVYIEDATGRILAFRMKTLVELGDTIKVTGTLTAYNGVNQIAAGCTAEIVEKAPVVQETITTVVGALAGESGAAVELTGKVVEIYYAWDEGYGNMSVYIEDATGRILAFRMKTLVELGDTIKVTGTLTAYNGVNQIAAGCTAEIVEKAPVEEPEQPGDSESVTIDFSDKANRTEFSTEIQVWEQNGIKVTNNKAASTTNVGDYANPARFYASSELIIEGAAKIAKVVITTAGNKNFNANFTLEGYTVTVDGTTCIIESAEGVDNITIAQLPYQVRVATIEVTYFAA